MAGHPLFLGYGQFRERQFPLILIIGREANASGGIEDTIDRMDFRKYPHCAFWNGAYSFAARAAGLQGGHELKRICERKGASFLVITYPLPICIDNKEPRKPERRMAVSDSELEAHFARVFGTTKIMGRVRHVLVSGLTDRPVAGDFGRAVRYIEEGCKKSGLKYSHVTYFAARRRAPAPEAYPELAQACREVYEEFKNS